MSKLTPIYKTNYSQFVAGIDSDPDLSRRTKTQYRRAIRRAENAGIDLFDPHTLREYASGLPTSSRAFLSAAVRRVTGEAIQVAKENATPDNVGATEAALMRLEAIQGSIKVGVAKGQKAHTWLSARGFTDLLGKTDDTPIGRRDRLALLLLGDCGLRRFEAAELKVSAVVKQGGHYALSIAGKGGKMRSVPLPKHTLADIQATKAAYGGTMVLKSFNRWGQVKDGISERYLATLTMKYGAMVGHPKLMPHDLRRTFAQIRYKAGVPVAQISKLLGHAKLATTERYLSIDVGDLMGRAFIEI